MKELKPKLALLTATEQTFVNSLPKIDLMTVTFDEAAESRLQLLMEKIQEMQAQRLVNCPISSEICFAISSTV